VNPARALLLEDRAGALKPGMPADITVFDVEEGEFPIKDTAAGTRVANRRLVPRVTFKDGKRIDCDLLRSHDDRNWLIQIADQEAPDAMSRITGPQREFLGALAERLSRIEWTAADVDHFNLPKALVLHEAFREVVADTGTPLKSALTGFFDCFLHHPFTMQVGIFLLRLPRKVALARLREASEKALA
jgi:dihydroorotase